MKNESQNPITTPDWRAERLGAIKRLYPDLFTDEGKINPIEIGALVADGNISMGEKFEFRWPGKMQAKKNAFTSSKARLAPDMDRSVNFDETKNVIIEGENLEVLKLLSKAYYNKVKCIYIDPPYNTGHDFVYSDDYSEGKQAYWEKNGVFHDGLKVDTNSESAGRYHTNWLNMMMPRLLLAQMMLKDDGVIFVSIDDNEVHNLRKLMDEVFGEENFVTDFIWNHRKSGQNDIDFTLAHNYTIVYSKNRELFCFNKLKIDEDKFTNPDSDVRGDWVADPMDAPGIRENLQYEIINPKTGENFLPPTGRHWRFTKEKFEQALMDNRIVFGKKGTSRPQFKRFKTDAVDKGQNITTLWTDQGTATEGTQETMEIFEGKKLFDTPKPTKFIRQILEISTTSQGDLILDFFAGSGTTGHAVMELNKEYGGKREFIMVQIPEAVEEKSEAFKAGYKKISEITIERVKRIGERIHAEKPEVDTGFKVFKLTTSIFPENTYQPDPEKSAEENVQALKNHYARARQHLLFEPAGKEMDLMYETLIKQGFMLTMTKERLREFSENEVWKVADGDRSAVVCLDADLKDATVKALAKYKDNRFIGLHRAVDTTKKWELTQTFGEALVLI